MESQQQQNEAPNQGRRFNKAFQIYKPRREGGGCASGWELNADKEAVFLDVAAQIGQMEGETNARFDWANKLTMKLGVTDIGELLAVLERRQKGIGPSKDGRHRGLFHKTAAGTTTLIFEESLQQPGWHLRIGVQKAGGEVQNLSHSISPGEGATLLVLLRLAIERIYRW
ncbi:MAG TPA: hypothetical protein PKG54_00350 [Phycisphaerae bacterium]|jgi:hypothetical protein|nr:hypothetical protein [Phycisphaerae bacterium]HOB72949.1 hypothetical protein [Phycisphaerae bacterium]HOJ53002.1 hypothetical protein [Phycisphaerae bacterium]HOL24739.1 hypothetical protein [Phycisphaerae bacterium]HPP19275.1 hypothetical protein [Phycisphaerae bacterium]